MTANNGRQYAPLFQIEHEGRRASVYAEGLTVEGVRYGFEGMGHISCDRTRHDDEPKKPLPLHLIRLSIAAAFWLLLLFYDFPHHMGLLYRDSRGVDIIVSAWFIIFCLVPWVQDALRDLTPQRHYLLLRMDSVGKRKYEAVLTGFPEEMLRDFARAANEARERYAAEK